MTTYQFFRIQKCSNLVTSLTTQLNNDQMPEFHCHCECSKCLPSAQSYNTSFQSPYLRSLYSLVNRSLWQVVPDNLKRFLKFSACFRLCFKLAVSLPHCTPHVHWVYIRRIWRPLVFCDEIWTAGPQPVLCAAQRCAVCADAPSCWKMNVVGSRGFER